MTISKQALIKAALALPDADKALLAEKLWETLPLDVAEPPDDPELTAELEARLAEYRRDPSQAIPWSQVQRLT
jgi:putative addiction module component (TIGR02574 family)